MEKNIKERIVKIRNSMAIVSVLFYFLIVELSNMLNTDVKWLNYILPPISIWFIFDVLNKILVKKAWNWKWIWWDLKDSIKQPPNLNGTWKGELVAQKFGGAEGEKVSHDMILVIKQDLEEVLAFADYTKSDSKTITANLILDSHNDWHLIYCYANTPDYGVVNTLSPHKGTTDLKITTKNEKKILIGGYYTDRNPKQTKGDIILERIL